MTTKSLRFFYQISMPVILALLPFLLPLYHFGFDISTFLTIVSLLFTILIGFFIAAATTNYLRLQSLLSAEGGNLVTIFNLIRLVQPAALKRIVEAIDRYLIAALDYELVNYIEQTQKEFNAIGAVVDTLDYPAIVNENFAAALQDQKNSLFAMRQEISLTARRIIGAMHWFILILLAVLIAVLLLSLRDGSLLTAVILAVPLIVLYLTLILVYEIDGNLFVEEKMSFEAEQCIFVAIGKMKYYPDYAITEGRIQKPKESYRLGVYKDFPRSTEKKIKIVRVV